VTDITHNPVVHTFHELSVNFIAKSSVIFSNNDECIISFVVVGNKGDTGLTGSSGSSGIMNLNNIGQDYLIKLNSDGSGTGQENLTFDGSTLNVTGKIDINSGGSGSSGYAYFEVLNSDPYTPAGKTSLYSKAVGTGGSGLYFKNDSNSGELVSRKTAITFGLIF